MRKKITSTFAKKVRNGEHTILYEFLPPPKNLSKTDIDRSLSLFTTMLHKFSIDAINLPEVKGETRSGERTIPSLLKLEPRLVCPFIQKYGTWEVIINRPIVYLPWDKQHVWLKKTYRNYGIRNFIFVGGETSKATYPGLSVANAIKAVSTQFKDEFPDIFVGGISIPHRPFEVERMLKKTQAGSEFFTTQILYEANAIKQLLKELWQQYKEKKIKPKMIFLSFAPIATKRDLELLQWLGVTIPKATAKSLASGWIGMGWHSIQVCKIILKDILQFVKDNDILIPIGLNIEHVSIHNLELSFILVEELSQIYLSSAIKQKRI